MTETCESCRVQHDLNAICSSTSCPIFLLPIQIFVVDASFWEELYTLLAFLFLCLCELFRPMPFSHAGFARRLGLADPQVYLSSRQQLSIECWMYEVWCDSCVKLCGEARRAGAKQLYSLLFIRQWASQEHWARAYAPHLGKRCLICSMIPEACLQQFRANV